MQVLIWPLKESKVRKALDHLAQFRRRATGRSWSLIVTANGYDSCQRAFSPHGGRDIAKGYDYVPQRVRNLHHICIELLNNKDNSPKS